ncbi:hypothetical protein FVE85_6574 [Porphyridium purpureum]|uniref:Uncharacterized protein n=1 Tax=Porphyridium purpureum TaxID=35688 RepID=A0A5J4Z4Q7_PORPP|nr:hypothetical protein FVE85_6574 [Porphyridium purpureum]|eukprot:POR8684..scf295_1
MVPLQNKVLQNGMLRVLQGCARVGLAETSAGKLPTASMFDSSNGFEACGRLAWSTRALSGGKEPGSGCKSDLTSKQRQAAQALRRTAEERAAHEQMRRMAELASQSMMPWERRQMDGAGGPLSGYEKMYWVLFSFVGVPALVWELFLSPHGRTRLRRLFAASE